MATNSDSTIAMTAYNVLVINDHPLGSEDIFTQAKRLQHPDLEMSQLQAALDGLVARERVTSQDGLYHLVANERLRVVKRNEKAGQDGWEGWQVYDPRIRRGSHLRPLEPFIGKRSPNA